MASGTGSLSSLRQLNRLRIVDSLRVNGTASRAELSRRTGLSRSTVSTLVTDLQRRGIVVEQPGQFAGEGQPGRPAAQLQLDPSAGAAIGVDFDHDLIRVAVCDLARIVLAEATVRFDVDHDAVGALDLAGDLVDQLLDEVGIGRDRVLGAGMALAGPIDHERAALHKSTVLPGWVDIDAAAELERRMGTTVYVDNDANLGALAEVTLGAGRNARFAAYVQIGSGIGAGMIVDGRPYRGAAALPARSDTCSWTRRAPCAAAATGAAWRRSPRRERSWGSSTRATARSLTVQEMIAEALNGDAGCRRAIADAGRVVGRVVAGLVNLFNPEMVVIGGDLGAAGELLLDPLRESVKRYALPEAATGLEVVAGELGERANLLGALALVLMQSEHEVAARVAGGAVA